jgi:type I restriction enzyme S subunit
LKGLEASILPLSSIGDLNPGLRIDAEFFNRQSLLAISQIRSRPHERLGNICARIQHPIEVKRDYEDEGLLTIMAKNVRSNRTDLSDPRFMPDALRPIVTRNKLKAGDVLVTRTGANFGQVASWHHQIEAFACADILVLRQPSVASGYLSSFLESAKGKPLILRGGYGAAQPHIAPPYLSDMLVPRLGNIEKRVDRLVNLSVEKEREVLETVNGAQDTLLVALGLADWRPPEPLAYTARVADVFASGRFDARFFAPRIRALLDLLAVDGRTIADVADPRREKFRPDACVVFDYIEISDIDGAGAATSTRLASDDAPSRATWHVRAGDIITSTVRPIRRLSAQITPEQEGFVCSSGFVVVTPRDVAPEVLLTYLRLPVICELLDLYASASMYPAITDADVFNLPLPRIPDAVADQVTQNVIAAKTAKARAANMLDAAKRAVEIAIEDGESAAITYLDQAEGTS